LWYTILAFTLASGSFVEGRDFSRVRPGSTLRRRIEVPPEDEERPNDLLDDAGRAVMDNRGDRVGTGRVTV
jgi:hypothetical protein